MSKKIGKVVAGLTAAAAVGAGVYYWLKKKDNVTEDDFEEDDFEEEFELDEDLEDVSEQREYVSLTPSSDTKEAEVPTEDAKADVTEADSEIEEPVSSDNEETAESENE